MTKIRYNDIMPREQLSIIEKILRSADSRFLYNRLQQLTAAIASTPVLSSIVSQNDLDTIHWHYFDSEDAGDWYITQLDPVSLEAYGYVRLGVSEFRVIDLNELLKYPSVRLDLYWDRKSVREVSKTNVERINDYALFASEAAKNCATANRKRRKPSHYKTAEAK